MRKGGLYGMGGNYEKGMFNQLVDLMAKLDAIEAEHKKDRKEIKALNSEITSLRKENASLKEKVAMLQGENAVLLDKCSRLEEENRLLRDDNERMKRILGNDSGNSSIPPSANPPWKAANTYNGRKTTKNKTGAQPGHKGAGLSKSDVEQKIRDKVLVHDVVDIGDKEKPYVTRYVLDLKVVATATEIRIHADGNGKYEIPNHLKGDVVYGDNIKAICAYLYSEGVVSIDRIGDFIRSLSGDVFTLSSGSIYSFCESFSEKCAAVCHTLEEKLLNAHEICTDATPVTNNGKMNYIRNFSTEDAVLYCCSKKKSLKALYGLPVLSKFTGVLCHDHETALYHFGTGHAECNVHLGRYLRKNTEETVNTWSRDMESFLNGMNSMRQKFMDAGESKIPEEKLAKYMARFDAIISQGYEQNETTRGKIAKKEEKTLLNRLVKYKTQHLLFMQDFRVHYSNNMSERDLRVCKNREKMAGGFRTDGGMQIYCNIMSFIGTMKRKKENILHSIAALMNGTLANI